MHNLYSPRIFRFFTIVIMTSLCLLFNYLTQINFTHIELPKNKPEYNAKNAQAKVYDKTGKLMYKINSATAWQYPMNDSLYMTNLNTIVYNESSDVMKYNLSSNDGWINYNKKLGYLGQNAILVVNNLIPTQIITIYGKDVDLDLNTNIFKSNEDVKATQNNSTITGHGFTYDKNKEFLTINSKVRVIYNK